MRKGNKVEATEKGEVGRKEKKKGWDGKGRGRGRRRVREEKSEGGRERRGSKA
jgi:hypothetical protein